MKIYARPALEVNPLLFGLFSVEIWTALQNWARSLFKKVIKHMDSSTLITFYIHLQDQEKACYV